MVFTAAGCAHAPRSATDSTQPFFTGEPLRVGSDGYEWSFGDGDGAQGPGGVHTFARAGRYEVIASRGGEVLSRLVLQLLPRPVLRAVPPDASLVLWIPAPKDSVGAIVDFCEQASSTFFTSDSATRDPFLRYLLEVAAQPPFAELALDPDEGLALFEVPDTPARVVAIGVVDERAAVNEAATMFAAEGFAIAPATSGAGVVALDGPSGEQLSLFADRGYLYLASWKRRPPDGALEELAERIAGMDPAGLSADADLFRLQSRVEAGSAWFFARDVALGGFEARHVVASLSFEGIRLSMDATLDGPRPVWDATRSAEPAEAHFHGAAGAHLFATASADPQALARMLEGWLTHMPDVLKKPGLDRGDDAEGRPRPSSFEAAFAGAASLVARIDVARTLSRLAEPDHRDFASAWALRADVDDVEIAGKWIRLMGEALGAKSGFSADGERLFVASGDPGRHAAASREALQTRFGAGAFSRGHFSAVLDVGALLRELELPPTDDGSRAARGFASEFLQHLTGIDTVFVDVVPQPGGAHARGSITLRPR